MTLNEIKEILRKIEQATIRGLLEWQSDEFGDFVFAKSQDLTISLKFIYVEPQNFVGADRCFIEISISNFQEKFAFGTECFCICLEILEQAFEAWSDHTDLSTAMNYCNRHFVNS